MNNPTVVYYQPAFQRINIKNPEIVDAKMLKTLSENPAITSLTKKLANIGEDLNIRYEFKFNHDGLSSGLWFETNKDCITFIEGRNNDALLKKVNAVTQKDTDRWFNRFIQNSNDKKIQERAESEMRREAMRKINEINYGKGFWGTFKKFVHAC